MSPLRTFGAAALLTLAAAVAAPVSAQVAACPETIHVDNLGGNSNFTMAAGHILIDDRCENAFYSVNGFIYASRLGPSPARFNESVTYGYRDTGRFDLSPGARRADPSRGIAGAGKLYLIDYDFTESRISTYDFVRGEKTSTVLVPMSVNSRHWAKYVAVAANGRVFVTTDDAIDGIQLYEYNPSFQTFRNRTGEIPWTLTAAALKASPDRSTIDGLAVGATTYAYHSATNDFRPTIPHARSARDTGISALTQDRKLRYSISPVAHTEDHTIAVQNVATGAVVARMDSRGIPVAVPTAAAVSADGTLLGLTTGQGYAVAEMQRSIPISTTALSGATGRSVLRFHNSGVTAGAVSLDLSDASNGSHLATWTSPVIPAGASVQYHMVVIERELGLHLKPDTYRIKVSAPRGFFGSLQHLLWNPEVASLTNATTCEYPRTDHTAGETAAYTAARARVGNDPRQIAGMHSTIFADYPSFVRVTSWADPSSPAAPVTLGIYDGRTGAKLGEYTTPPIAGKGARDVSAAQIEAALRISPASDQHYYVVIAPASFKGFLQHRMRSGLTGLETDVSATCPINSDFQIADSIGLPDAPARQTFDIAGVYSTAQRENNSFFHINNEYSGAARVTITLHGEGAPPRTWTSPEIPPYAELQVLVDRIEQESGVTGAKPQMYTATVQSEFPLAVQHYVWRPRVQQLTNASTCSMNAPTLNRSLYAVHSSMYEHDYPSAVVLHNNLAEEQNVSFSVRKTDGTYVGEYGTHVPAFGRKTISIAEIENYVRITPSWDVPRYNLSLTYWKADGPVNAVWMQHIMLNRRDGREEDMTQACRPRIITSRTFPTYPVQP